MFLFLYNLSIFILSLHPANNFTKCISNLITSFYNVTLTESFLYCDHVTSLQVFCYSLYAMLQPVKLSLGLLPERFLPEPEESAVLPCSQLLFPQELLALGQGEVAVDALAVQLAQLTPLQIALIEKPDINVRSIL